MVFLKITSTQQGLIDWIYVIIELHFLTALSEEYRPPQLFQYPNSEGITMYGMMYQPHNYEPGQKYPTVMFVYGGPQVQLVTNSYKSIR